MSVPDAALLRLSATLVAQHFHFRCGRRLRYEMCPPEGRAGVVPPPGPDPTGGSAPLLRMGRRWERHATRRALQRFGPERVAFSGWSAEGAPLPLPWERTLATLREPGGVELLVQPELRLPDPAAFAKRFGVPAGVRIAAAQPDLLRLRRGAGGGVLLEVIDIKGSRSASVAHFAQVAFYSLLLEEICRSERLAAGAEGRSGWVWTRGSGRPRRFALGAYRYHVERFLREELPPLAAAPPAAAPWHFGAGCAGCQFAAPCRAEADATDDLARVVGLSPLSRATLHGREIRTVRSLAGSLRRDTFAGCEGLERGAARLRKQAQALGWGKTIDVEPHTEAMAAGEAVRVIVCAEPDPVSGVCFALGVRTEGVGAADDTRVWIAERPTHAAERELVGGLLVAVEGALGAARRASAPFGLFVYDRADAHALAAMLRRHLADPLLRDPVARVLDVLGGSGAAPVTVLADAVATLFALPVPYAYDLAAVSAALLPEGDAHSWTPSPCWVAPLGSAVAWQRARELWRLSRRPAMVERAEELASTLRDTVRSKLAAVDSVIRAVRERAARRGRERLLLRPDLPAATDAPLRHPLLERLRVSARLEAAAEAAAVRALHALHPEERAARWECIRGMERVERLPDGRLVFEFDPVCRDAKFRPGDFALVLSNEGTDTLRRAAREPWLRRRLLVELVEFDLTVSPPRVTLAPGSGFARAEAAGEIHLDRRCVLDRAGIDFGISRVLATLAALDEQPALPAVGLLEGRTPDGWTSRWGDSQPVWEVLVEPTAARRGAAVLNREQTRAWRAAFRRPVSVVWGPPGTGKTYLLAWMLLGIAEAARRAGRPCRIGVSAGTHRAIVNVLARLAAEAAEARSGALRVVKLRGSGSEADADLDGSAVELAADDRLPALLREAAESGVPLVAGCTVWSLWKQMRAMAGGKDAPPLHPCFDVVVIDEASQMTMPQALIALSALRAGGQAIVCGDDRQLAPVLHTRGSTEDDPLAGSAFAHFAAHFGRLPLRESRRMNTVLTEYPRELFYPGFHAHDPERRIRLSTAPGPRSTDDALAELFLDPDAPAVLCSYRGIRAGARNPWEAATVARLAVLLRDRLVDPATGRRFTPERLASHGLAILSPHRAQNAAILAELLAAGWPPAALPTVDTVERMQGNEREVILVSYGVADAEYAEAEAEFLLDPHRFNVAITRARAKSIVFASEEMLGVLPRDEAVATASMALKGYVAHCADGVREIELPDGRGGTVRATLRSRRGRGVKVGSSNGPVSSILEE